MNNNQNSTNNENRLRLGMRRQSRDLASEDSPLRSRVIGRATQQETEQGGGDAFRSSAECVLLPVRLGSQGGEPL